MKENEKIDLAIETIKVKEELNFQEIFAKNIKQIGKQENEIHSNKPEYVFYDSETVN